MRRVLLLLVLSLLVVPAASAKVQLVGVDASAYPVIRATVVSSAGAAVAPGLAENGKPVVGLTTDNLGRAKAIVIAVDRSQSMKGKPLTQAAAAARGFVAGKARADEISVVAFGSKPVVLTQPSTATIDADAALRDMSVATIHGTALYDAVVASAGALSTSDLHARVVVVLTDGKDVSSVAGLAEAIRSARNAGAAVYPIGIEGAGFSRAPLLELAKATGGRYFPAASAGALAAVYGSLAKELARTWRVEYVSAALPGDSLNLLATVAGAGSARAAVIVPANTGASAPDEPSKLLPPELYGSGGALAVGIVVGALALIALTLLIGAKRGSWVRNRLAVHVGQTRGNTRRQRKEQRLALLASLFRTTERAFGHLRHWRSVQRMLERGETPLRTVEFFYLVAGSGILAGFLFAVAAMPPFVIVLGMAGGASVPVFFVYLRMRRRLSKFETQLPDLLITVAASLKAGHSFKQGLQAVVDEGQPPASSEFRRVLTETGLGRPMDDALAEMAERTGSANFEFAITAVTIQRQVGGSLANLFDMVADTVRQRQQFARKIRSLTAMGRMSAYTLVGLPFFLALAITLLNPGYLSPLYNTGTGHFLVILGLVMIGFGSLILKKIVSFRG